jgi:spermidine synthase
VAVKSRPATLLAPIFALTGFSALTSQVVWQRVMSLHSGVDLGSITTVVAAFLAGLGIGSVLGGRLADRLGPERSLVAFALANVGIGLFAWASVWVLYDVYRNQAAALDSRLATFLFNMVVLIVPTTLMGLSLPLVARAVTARIADAGPLIGRLYGINTIGAAAGSAVSGWFFLGTFGFVNTTRIAGTLNLLAAVAIIGVWRIVAAAKATGATPAAATVAAAADPAGDPSTEAAPRGASGPWWIWLIVYATTGAVALSLEHLFFRLVDAQMRSNSYSFAHVLTLYLLLFGVGSAIGSRLVGRGRNPQQWFLWIQFLVGVTALGSFVLFVRGLPSLGFDGPLENYFSGAGYNGGFGDVNTFREWAKIGVVYLGMPLFVMTLPVLFMGMSFPFVQAIVTDQVETLGRRTGLLMFANVVGNVAGTLLTGFVFLDTFGTAGTFRLIAVVLGFAGLGAALTASKPQRRPTLAVGSVALIVLLLVIAPSNQRMWAFLHGLDDDSILLSESHSCAATIKYEPREDRPQLPEATLYINGSIQNGHPYDDFHVLIGLLPALLEENPERALAIGLGIGSTTYGMLADPRLDQVTTVELCGDLYDLAAELAKQPGREDFVRMLQDPRYVAHTGDGRKFLLVEDDSTYDIITVDTLRSTAAFSGSLYSREFYELLSDRLDDDGNIAQWVPTHRIVNSAAQVFPYIVAMKVPEYNDSVFMIAGKKPLAIDRSAMMKRFQDVPADMFTPEQRARLEQFVASAPIDCIRNGELVRDIPGTQTNRDLRPRDEYFINNVPPRPLVPPC